MGIQFVTTDGAKFALTRLLQKAGFIDAQQAATIENIKDLFPVAHFVRLAHLDERAVIDKIAADLNIKALELNKETTKKILTFLDNEVPSAITVPQWTAIRAVPVPQDDGKVLLAMANPFEKEVKTSLEFAIGRQIDVAIAREADIMSVLAHRDISGAAFDLDSILYQADSGGPGKGSDEAESVTVTDISAPPVVRLVNKIFAEAILSGASDIHLVPCVDRVQVRIRVDGLLRPLFDVPRQFSNSMISRIKLLSSLDISERRRPQDGRLAVNFGRTAGKKEMRISTVPTCFGETLVARIITSDVGEKDFKMLGMEPKLVKSMERALTGSSKLILVSGPTGSGKTSTLYASLMHVRDGSTNIVTIEDPVEYRFDGINQLQVNTRIGLTFAQGLKAILRQDPDVIMVGEIRDDETASIAMQVAQTGHLVLSSIHTISATNSITRLRDLGVPSYLIASSLGVVVAQRLVRRLCKCAGELKEIELERCCELGLNPRGKLMARGCQECDNTGYKGRAAIYSFLEITDPLRHAIRLDASEIELETIARRDGFLNLEECAMRQLDSGITSLSELERVLGTLDRFCARHTAGSADSKRPHIVEHPGGARWDYKESA